MQERGVCAARENSSTFAPIVSMLVAFASAGTKTVCVPGARASLPARRLWVPGARASPPA
jgi:hypothetical protein